MNKKERNNMPQIGDDLMKKMMIVNEIITKYAKIKNYLFYVSQIHNEINVTLLENIKNLKSHMLTKLTYFEQYSKTIPCEFVLVL